MKGVTYRVISLLMDCAILRTVVQRNACFGSFSVQVAMSQPVALMVADNIRPPRGPLAPPGDSDLPEYEPGHSERQVTGFVAVGLDGRWSATLAVPMTGDQTVLVTLDRHGPTPAGGPAVPETALVIPPGEIDAVITLLQGIVAQGRRDGVLVRRRRTPNRSPYRGAGAPD
jgi:hypothetical protein